jgi:hypothetical protein
VQNSFDGNDYLILQAPKKDGRMGNPVGYLTGNMVGKR